MQNSAGTRTSHRVGRLARPRAVLSARRVPAGEQVRACTGARATGRQRTEHTQQVSLAAHCVARAAPARRAQDHSPVWLQLLRRRAASSSRPHALRLPTHDARWAHTSRTAARARPPALTAPANRAGPTLRSQAVLAFEPDPLLHVETPSNGSTSGTRCKS